MFPLKISFDMSKAVMAGNRNLVDKLKIEANSLISKKSELLKNIKIPERCS